MNRRLCYVTITVSDLKSAKAFYENICGFKPDIEYQPTSWQAYEMGEHGGGFAIIECKKSFSPPGTNMVDFFIPDIDSLWEKLKPRVKVVSELQHTPWGSYKFCIEDPDGNCLGFVQSPE